MHVLNKAGCNFMKIVVSHKPITYWHILKTLLKN